MTNVGWIGVGLLIVAIVAVIIEGVLAAVWGMAVAKRTRVLSELVETERAELQAEIRRLRLALEETTRLWRPYRRALRWLRHPLTIALLESLARRRRAATS